MPRNAAAFEVPNGSYPDARKAGAYYFMRRYDMAVKANVGDPIGITHACPCGCGAQGCIWFRGGSMNGSGTNSEHEWDVSGEWPKATLSPSIGFGRLPDGKYHWHGFLRNGVFVEE